MNASSKEKYRKRLRSLSERMQPSVQSLVEDVHQAAGGRETGELTNAPMHLGDMGTEEYLFDLSATFLANETFLAAEIHDALERLDDGTFGVCERCDVQIATERLEALPFARFCLRCADAVKEALPKADLNQGRPKNPRDTLAPEGDMNEDRRSTAGEDPFYDTNTRPRRDVATRDEHAVGTPGGGAATGGLAGSNLGRGDPDVAELNQQAGSGIHDVEPEDEPRPAAGRTGGAVGGTPANKRAKTR